MSHLENLISEYYDWKGYLVKRNIKVGRLKHGGWESELDVVAYNPHSGHRFSKKFKAATKYIFSEVFIWLNPKTKIEQIAVLISHPKGRDSLSGGRIVSIDKLIFEIEQNIKECGITAKNAIPEQYPLLRTIQMTENGYYKSF